MVSWASFEAANQQLAFFQERKERATSLDDERRSGPDRRREVL